MHYYFIKAINWKKQSCIWRDIKINPFHSNTLSLYGLILSDLNQKERALLYLKRQLKFNLNQFIMII